MAWATQFGTENRDEATAVAIDGDDDIYVVGTTMGNLAAAPEGSYDAFVRKYGQTPDGISATLLWTYRTDATITGVAADAEGNIYLTGYMGAFNSGTGLTDHRAFLMKVDSDGVEQWARLFPEEYDTIGSSVSVDSGGNVIVSGNTVNYYDLRSPAGTEMFTRSVSPLGVLQWQDVYGESGCDLSYGNAVDADGNVFTTGYTYGQHFPAFERVDAYLRKYIP